MRKIYITFGGKPYDPVTKKIVEDGVKFGADEVWVYDDVWLMNQPFYTQNKWLWDHPHKRGFGWYAWKPFIIYHALQRLNDGDIVLFTDADCYPIANFSVLYDQCDKDGGVMLFSAISHRHYTWCKRDCYIVMGQDEPKYYDVQHGVARFMLFQKGKWKATQFLMEWLTYCVNPLATTFDKSTLSTEPIGFKEHRTEQAIMTNLAHKYGLKLYREADQCGEPGSCTAEQSKQDRELYPQLFVQYNPLDAQYGGFKFTSTPVGSEYFNIEERKPKYLHYNLYCNGNVGVCNLITSVENAIIIAALTNSKIKFYGRECIDRHSNDPHHPNLKIFNLFDINVDYEIINSNNVDSNIPCIPYNTTEQCVYYFEDKPTQEFLNGRTNTFDLSNLLFHSDIRTKDHHTLGFYSYLFYLNDKRKQQIINLIKKAITPKQKYIDICNSVLSTNNITNFNCIHLRRGDFCYHKNTNEYPCFNVELWFDKLTKNYNKNETLLIATDHNDKEFFKLITDYYEKVYFINDLLDSYPICDVEKGLVTMLIAAKSSQFIGTFQSTFTGIIQRYRMYNGFQETFRYLFSNNTGEEIDNKFHFVYNNPGKYTWNRINNITKNHSARSFHWKREWYESCY